jgi:hypothetical protein
MGAIRNLVVKLTGDTSGLQKSLGDAQSKVKSTVGGIQKSTGALASIGAALGPIGIAIGAVTAGLAAFGGVAGTAISAVADGVSGAVGTLTDLAQETMPLYKEAAEAEAKLVTVMRQRMGATNEMISSALELAAAEQRTGAVEGDAIIAGQQQLSTFLHNADALKILTPAMADLAAQQKGVNATSGDLTTIANLMGKAMDGSAGALKKTGISFSEAQAKILKTGTEMQRAAMLAQIITDNVGDMNQALASTGIGKIQQMTNAWGDVKEQVGQVFTNLVAAAAPAIMTVINFLSTALSYATAFSNAFAGITGMFGGVSATAEDAASGAGSAADSIDGMGDSVKKAGAAAKKSLASFDQLNILSKGGGGGGVSGGGDDDKNNGGGENGASAAESWVQKFLGNFDFTPLKTAINGLLQALKPLADDAWSGLKWAYNNILVPLGKWTIEKALPASIDVLTAALKALDPIIDALKPLGEWLWNNFLKPIGQWAGERVITLLRNMASAFTAIGNWAKDHREIIQKIGVAFGTLATVFGAIVGTGIVWVIQSLVGPVAAVAAIVGVLTAAFVAVSVAIQTVAQ